MKKAPLYVGAAAVYPYSKALEASLERVSRFDETYSLARRSPCGAYLHVPRAMCPDSPDDRRVAGSVTNFTSLFRPRSEDQARVMAEAETLLWAGESFIVHAPTGWGKTILGCALAAGVGRRTLVITTKEDIVDQWITSAREILGLSEAEVGVWRADTEPAPEAKFVVGLIHSILKGPERYPNVDFESFGFVIVDESHRLGAEQFSQCMWWLPAKLRLGLSATPKRKDGKDDVIEGHIGPVRVTALLETLIPNVIMRRTQWKVPLVARYGQVVKLPHEAGRIGAVTANMATNIARNQLILEFLLAALGKSRSTIVFSDTLKHLLILRDMLLGAGVAREHIGFYVGANGPVQVYGDVPAKLRKAARNRDAAKPILLATYAMASEATNLPWLDTAVLATPRSDVVQVVGRIRREYPDKKPPVVLDLVDEDSALLANYAKSRLRWYKQVGAKIKLY